SSRSTGRTRLRAARAWRASRGWPRDARHDPRLRDHDPRTRDLPRHRGDLEGADPAAHAADVGDERHSRRRHRRRDDRARPARQECVHVGRRLRGRRPRSGDRVPRLRRHRPDARDVQEPRAPEEAGRHVSYNLANLLYLITIVAFVLALRFLSNPAQARRGNQIGAVGMVVAIVVTWIRIGTTSWWAIALAILIGGAFGAVAARKVRMTAMPQMVALFNGVGGGAAALIALA